MADYIIFLIKGPLFPILLRLVFLSLAIKFAILTGPPLKPDRRLMREAS